MWRVEIESIFAFLLDDILTQHEKRVLDRIDRALFNFFNNQSYKFSSSIRSQLFDVSVVTHSSYMSKINRESKTQR